jgi:hypothetical protein
MILFGRQDSSWDICLGVLPQWACSNMGWILHLMYETIVVNDDHKECVPYHIPKLHLLQCTVLHHFHGPQISVGKQSFSCM